MPARFRVDCSALGRCVAVLRVLSEKVPLFLSLPICDGYATDLSGAANLIRFGPGRGDIWLRVDNCDHASQELRWSGEGVVSDPQGLETMSESHAIRGERAGERPRVFNCLGFRRPWRGNELCERFRYRFRQCRSRSVDTSVFAMRSVRGRVWGAGGDRPYQPTAYHFPAPKTYNLYWYPLCPNYQCPRFLCACLCATGQIKLAF